MSKCISCSKVFPGPKTTCADCLDRIGKWRRGNPDKVRAANKKWYEDSEHRFKRRGITKEIYEKKLSEQGGVCAICGKPPKHDGDMVKKAQQSLHIDHDHATQEFRGLLCGQCNTAIGKFQDDPKLLMQAIGYLFKGTHPSSKRFYAVLAELCELHAKKQQDYGKGDDPFANVRSSKEWGVSPWIGALIRLNDKVKRLQAFAIKGSLANEGVEDSLRDISVYSAIALVLYEQESKDKA
jgi:hypothetical protein